VKLRAKFVAALILSSLTVPALSQTQMGEDLFKAKCTLCHGADGKGQTPAGKGLHARDFSSADVQKQSDTDLAYIIAQGKNKMPKFSGLSAEQVTNLVKYIRGMKK
jgi:mono/diheme cytochrome c family protein